MSMEQLRQRYNVPAKRNLIVRESLPCGAETSHTGRVLSSDGQYIYVRSYQDGKRRKYHPFDLDYSTSLHGRGWVHENEWARGCDFKRQFDNQIDAFNRRLNNRDHVTDVDLLRPVSENTDPDDDAIPGRDECPECYGRGHDWEGLPCPQCDGTGEIVWL